MTNIFKNLFIPSGKMRLVVAYESWVVRYKSTMFDGSNLCYNCENIEVFTSKSDADKFVLALTNAHKLLRDTGYVFTVSKN